MRACELARRRKNFVETHHELGHEIARLEHILDEYTADEILDELCEAKSNWEFYGVDKPQRIPDEAIDHELERAKAANLAERKVAYCWRTAEEMRLAKDNGWYVIMDTLTLDSLRHRDWRDAITNGWRQYIAKVRHAVGMEIYGREYRNTEQRRYLRYIACVERGKLGRVHLHCLLFLADIPQGWKRDPNHGQARPTRREISGMKPIWDRGFSTPVAVRTGIDDPWATLGWRWPVDHKGMWLPYSGPEALGHYIAKYCGKTLGEKPWRMRLTRGFGSELIRKLAARIPTPLLRPAMEEWPRRPNSANSGLPTSLMRAAARRERFSRIWDSRTTGPQLCSHIWRRGKRPTGLLPRLRALRSWIECQGLEQGVLSHWQELTRDAACYRRFDDFEQWLEQQFEPHRKAPVQGIPQLGGIHA